MSKRSQPTLGVIMLDTQFKRVLGDIGNPDSFDFPVLYQKVAKASVQKIVSSGSIDDLLPAFVEAARRLEDKGVSGITTSCGFLTLAQKSLAAAVDVPLITSSLFLVPDVHVALQGKPVVIVTANSQELTDLHLRAAKISLKWDVRVIGLEGCPAFKNSILRDGDPEAISVDAQSVENELTDLCQNYLNDNPDVGGFVFECTNLQPYADRVGRECRRPVWGINNVIAQLNPLFRVPVRV